MDDSSSQKEHLNPAQSDYEDKFDSLSRAESSSPNSSKSAQPEQASDISEAENTGSETNGYYRPTGGGKTKGRGRQLLKKFGPTTGIVGLLVGGGIGLGGLLSPSLLLVHLKETLTSSFNDSDGAIILRSNKLLWKKFKQTKGAFTESSIGKCNVRCKFGSLSKATAQAMQARAERFGFNIEMIETKDALGRTRFQITEMGFPSGTTALRGEDLPRILSDPKNASAFKKLMPMRGAVFTNTKFGNMLFTKFGLKKISEIGGKGKQAVLDSIRKALKIPTPDEKLSIVENARKDGRYTKLFAAEGVAKGIGAKANAANTPCIAYNIGKTLTYGVKAAKVAAFAGFAMMFLSMADKIKAGANPDPDAVSQLGSQLTSYPTDEKNPNYGKSATDSTGYKMAAYGDYPSALNEQDSKFSISLNGESLKIVLYLVASLVAAGAGGLIVAKTFCKTAAFTGMVTACAEEIAAAAITAAETAGAGALISLGVCGVKLLLITLTASALLGTLIGKLVTAAVSSEIPNLGPDTYGADAGNAITSGTANILGGHAASYGMKPGTKEEIKQYALDTSEVRNSAIAVEMYDAKSEPLNAYNQYSFIGMVLKNVGIYKLAYNQNISRFASVFGLFGQSLQLFFPKSFAAVDIATRKSDLYGRCSDSTMQNMGIDADIFCNPSYVMSSSELSSENDDITDWMLNNNYIDDEGDAKPGTNYEKYLTYCANRENPFGESDLALENDDYLWSLGMNCIGGDEGYSITKDVASKFRVYTMDKSLNDTFEEL